MPETVIPKISQETLAETIGTTRSRVSFFMNRFRKLGFLDYGENGMQVHRSLLNVVLHDQLPGRNPKNKASRQHEQDQAFAGSGPGSSPILVATSPSNQSCRASNAS